MLNKLWIYKDYEESKVDILSNQARISRLMSAILVSRGITEVNDVRDFLNPSLDNLYSPFLLKDMDLAVDRIIKAIECKEKIVIYGDYDVDGVTSTSMLLNFLHSQGADVDFFIPDRFDEGYGLSQSAVDKVIQMGAELVITVDCGISALQEVKSFSENNIEIIITDHHECREILPDAFAIINPHRFDCEYPFKDLAGVGVVFKLVHALCMVLNLGKLYLEYLDLATLGTIADVMSLLGENRIIVKHGLEAIEKTSRVGLKALIGVAGLEGKHVNSYAVGFALGPRINAAGRTGSAARAVNLFRTDDAKLAEIIALELNEENKYRQETEKDILRQAIELVESDVDLEQEKVIVVTGKGWHHGIIGIVASRITEKYYRPCILISDDDGIGKGSGRSIEGFNLFQALSDSKDLLLKFGGHELAAGLSLDICMLSEFKKKINTYADVILDGKDLIPRIKIDYNVCKEDVTLENVQQLELLAPFGPGNPNPVFSFENLKISDIRTISDKKHLKLKFENRGLTVDAVGFNMGELSDTYITSDRVDSVFSLEINTWNNVNKVQMLLKDIKPHKAIVFSASNEYNIDMPLDMIPEREDLAAVYKYIKNNAGNQTDSNSEDRLVSENIYELSRIITGKYGVFMNQRKLQKCIEIFEELELITMEKYGKEGIIITLCRNDNKKVNLEDSLIYMELLKMKEKTAI